MLPLTWIERPKSPMPLKPLIKNLTIAVLLLLYGLGFGFMQANAAYAVGASHTHGADGHELNAYVVQVDLHIPQAQAKLANTTHLPINSVKESKLTAAAVPFLMS